MCELFYHSKSGTYFPGESDGLSLYSIGTRTKFKLVVYGIGLYVDNQDTYGNTIDERSFELNDKKMLLLNFYRSVGNEKIMNAFIEGLQQRINIDGLENEINQFKQFFSSIDALNYKDTLKLIFENGSLVINYCRDGHQEICLGKLANELLIKNIYNIYLDDNSVTQDIKKRYFD